MYELVQVSENCFYVESPSKVGIVRTGEESAVLIDSGSDKDAAKKVKRILDARHWTLKAIYNTHSHADHIGGNQYLQSQTGCRVFARGIDCAFTEYPVLEPALLYGGFPLQELRSKFLMAKESVPEKLTEDVLPQGLSLLPLPGHSFDMAGFRSEEGVVYLADCVSSEETLEKYSIGYLYDVAESLETLKRVETMKAECFVPSHAPQTTDIAPLARLNREAILSTAGTIRDILSSPMTFEELLAEIFRVYALNMTLQQRMLIGSTVKSYLAYLINGGLVAFHFENNRMIWQSI